ncbi:hypothetical protein CgunFtcFv8_027593 [Champsocephalus gunnari]|uniref:SAM domain-containing protein n=1 Tax=Champsocephalus gunnari TaxID=52237 RepID=A0AAN8HWY8_CHAGU|nr:hypothetical protein CgunFtcFv8_027593 [Champsocephalus gunnari]
MCRHLQCDSLFSSQPFSLCHRKSVKQEALEAPSLARGGKRSLSGVSPPYAAPLSPKLLRPEAHPSEAETREDSTLMKDQHFMDSASVTPRPPHPGSTPRRLASPPSEPGAKQPLRQVEASSTTGPEVGGVSEGPGRGPSCWSIEEVMQFVREADPAALAPHAELFRKHEIDGRALLLLRSDMIMKYMGLKLGPALKLCHHIERLKQGRL